MYIPLTFFGSQGSCITATTTTTSGTGSVTTGSFISGGFYWQYYQFNNNANTNLSTASFVASLNIISGSTSQAKLLVVGGGGGGGYNPGDSCINPYIDTAGSAGGGGGGGVVYYDQFSISSGSYEISVAAGGRGGYSSRRVGFDGSLSYFNNKSFEYTPFTSSFITAYGGGAGAGNTNNCISAGYGIGNSGASSGGGSQTAIAGITVPAVGAYSYTGGNPAVIQGYGAGSITTNPNGNDRAMGGGGAAAASANITNTYNPTAGSPGGSGIFYNLTGTQLGYGAGGSGVRWAPTGQGSLTGDGAGWGNAGSGGYGGFGGRFGNIRGSEPGLNGTVIIAWPVCSSTFACKTFEITGSGGQVNWSECKYNQYVTQSAMIGAGYGFTACLQTFSGSNTPILLTGAITTASVKGNCDNVYTSSTSCSCTSYYYVPNGTQTVTWAYCNSNLLRSRSISTGTVFCTNPAVPGQGLTGVGSTITLLGICSTGSCA